MTEQLGVAKYSREYFLARLGPELVEDVLAKVAAAPAPSPEKVAELARLFAAVPLAAESPEANRQKATAQASARRAPANE